MIKKRLLHTCKEISNLFKVNFHVRNLHKVFEMRITFYNGLEYLFSYARDDSSKLF